MTGVTFFVTYQVKPECVDALCELLSAIKSNLSNIQGCRSLQIFRHADEPERITLVEEWESRELHEANFERIRAEGLWEKVQAMLAGAPEAYYANEL